jgi:hypothetical protein
MQPVDPKVDRPSLRGAKLRSQRASEHIQELEAIVAEFDRKNPSPVVVTLDKAALARGEVRDVQIDWSRSHLPPSLRIGIIAGEALYNLRAALDYLVFALAWLDSGRVQRHTQFPTADTLEQWRKQKTSRLKGVNVKHRGMIERYQPSRGCDWTRMLRELSNPDKHRTLTSVSAQFQGEFRVEREKAEPVVGDPARVSVTVGGQRASVNFWNEAPVVETLSTLAVEVATALQEFQGDFGESDSLGIRAG